VERENKREGGGYHLRWDGDGLRRVQANKKRIDDASVQFFIQCEAAQMRAVGRGVSMRRSLEL